MNRKLMTLALLVLAVTAVLTGAVSAQTPEPTQTPYMIYVVVTATPEPETETQIQRPATPAVSLVNSGTAVSGSSSSANIVTLTNETITQDQSADGGIITKDTASATSATSGCTIAFQVVSEPTYAAGCTVQRGQTFWKKWVIQNTGTCTWTPEYTFVFDSGWQIGSTRFSMNKTTAPGESLTVTLGMIPDQQRDGTYYSTYVLQAPDGTKGGTLTATYNVRGASWFAPTATPIPWNRPWEHGSQAGPVSEPYGSWPWFWPWW